MNAILALAPHQQAPQKTHGASCFCCGGNTVKMRFGNVPVAALPYDQATITAHPQEDSRLEGITERDFNNPQYSPMQKAALALIAAYQKFTHNKDAEGKPQNRFFTCYCKPGCSQYTAEAIKKHGVLEGCLMGFKRIMTKCHPYKPVMVELGYERGLLEVGKAMMYELGLKQFETSHQIVSDIMKRNVSGAEKLLDPVV